ncbi:MAG: efflux RND transporter periplasmic adaptor subunit [bacterium]
MNPLKRIGLPVAGIVLVILAGWAGYHEGRKQVDPKPVVDPSRFEDQGPVASVQVTELRRKRIEETLNTYGTVIVTPGKSQTFSVPFECSVRKVLVTEGQRVAAKTPLLIVEPSPDTQLQFNEAKNQLKTAQDQLRLTQELIDMKLGTRQDLASAKAEVQSLELKVKSFQDRGVDGERRILAEEKGLVSLVHVQQGEIVPAGNVLLETAGENDIQARLGVESEDIGHVREGQQVLLHQVNVPGDSEIPATLIRVTHQVNPETRLIDIYVTPEQGGRLLLHDYIWGEIVVASTEALVAPRAAVLPIEGGHVLYTVENGRAKSQQVQLGLENQSEYEVMGEGLHAGQQIVVVGNLELSDGMRVSVESTQ